MRSYVDTSALMKWYLPEPGAATFAQFAATAPCLITSRLTMVEFRCVLARRRRAGEIPEPFEELVAARFSSQIAAGELQVEPMADGCYSRAIELIAELRPLPLRALDSLHLTAARQAHADELATADRQQGRAAEALGLPVRFFGDG